MPRYFGVNEVNKTIPFIRSSFPPFASSIPLQVLCIILLLAPLHFYGSTIHCTPHNAAHSLDPSSLAGANWFPSWSHHKLVITPPPLIATTQLNSSHHTTRFQCAIDDGSFAVLCCTSSLNCRQSSDIVNIMGNQFCTPTVILHHQRIIIIIWAQ